MLDGKTIWITRPAGQADSLMQSLAAQGANVKSLPMLAIEPVVPDSGIRTTVMNLDQYDLLFFISTNSAALGMELIHDYWPQFPVGVAVYAVGPSTAEVLARYNLDPEFPGTRMSSEALLALPSLSAIDGRKVLIVRGVGGRELLAQELRNRGASVDYLELYRRDCPEYPPGALAAEVEHAVPAAIVVTSAEALDNLRGLLERDAVPVASIPLFVSSARIAEKAKESGFLLAVTMSGADDRAIIESLADRL